MYLFIDFCAIHPLIGWLLAGLLGLLLGWLIWGRLKSRIEELEASNRKLVSSNNSLSADLEACQAASAQYKSDISMLEGRLREKEFEARELSDSVTRQRNIISDFERQAKLGIVAGETAESVSDGHMSPSIVEETTKEKDEVSEEMEEAIFEEVVTEEEVIEEQVEDEVITDKGVVGTNRLYDAGITAEEQEDVVNEIPAMEEVTEKEIAEGVTKPSKPNLYAVLKEDDLQVVEGIGPKMSEVLNNAGINNWKDLSEKSTADLRAILDSVNPKRYRIIDPSPWPKQAKLALDGNWDELIVLQKNLSSGRKAGATGQTDSKVEKLLIKQGVLKRWKQNDLTAVEGVGPKISGLLKDAGIDTWRKLANTEVSRIQKILDDAGKRYKLADPSTWPKQAEMAADGRFDDLQEYQDFLQGGK